MHDVPGELHWHEPVRGRRAGFGMFRRAPMPYDRFMDSEGIPVFRGLGVRRVHDLPLKAWPRLGGRGSYIQLHGTEGLFGLYLVEIAPSGALNPERHLYEKVVYVVEGRGTTEVWQEGQTKRHAFEWQSGSLFAIPLNTAHRFINASRDRVLLLCGTTAPNMMNLLDNVEFIFDCPHNFSERFAGSGGYFQPGGGIEPDPVRGLAMMRTNYIADIVGSELLLDNRRSPGYRRIEPAMAGNRFYLSISEHEAGRYSMAHRTASAAVVICIKGKGYSYAWQSNLGPTPWKDGKADKVLRQEFESGGLVSTAPGESAWFHQEFGTNGGPLRFTTWHGPNNQSAHKAGRPGEPFVERELKFSDDGSIPYDREDDYVRSAFEEVLRRSSRRNRIGPKLHS